MAQAQMYGYTELGEKILTALFHQQNCAKLYHCKELETFMVYVQCQKDKREPIGA
jgi:hypothetical protein